MNKSILLSLAIIGVVAVGVTGLTSLYFTDTETSEKNTFKAGELDLKIDNTCHYNGMVCALDDSGNYVWQDEGASGGYVETEVIKLGDSCACSWTARDLDGEQFYDYGDIKPGDWGEHTLSIYVDNNDAYGRILTTAIENRENLCTEPEGDVDGTCSGRWCGELAQNMYTFSWKDDGTDKLPGTNDSDGTEGDNIWQDPEIILTEDCGADGVIRNGQTYCPIMPKTLAEATCASMAGNPQGDLPGGVATQPSNIGFIAGGVTHYIGTAWFVPYSVNNIIQGDSIKANISFEIEQARHNTDPFDN